MRHAGRRRRIAETLELVGLTGREHHRVHTYSKGMQQRLGVACALIGDPELVFLDEPTSALDPLGRREMRELIVRLREGGKTVFLNSHLLGEVEAVCDTVAIIGQQPRQCSAGEATQVIVIARLTFREPVRRRVLLLTLILTVVFLVLFTLGVRAAARQISPIERELTASVLGTQLLVLGLFFGNFIVAFLAIFSAVGVVSTELENGVLQTIVTRPLSRAAVIGGKYAGLGALLALYAALYFGAILAIVRHYTGTGTTGEPGALALFCLTPLALLAGTVLGSTSLPTVANGMAVLGLYVVAFVGGMCPPGGRPAAPTYAKPVRP